MVIDDRTISLSQYHRLFTMIIEGSLEVKLPTIWTDEKQRWEESEKRREEERRSKRESLRRKKIQVREKVGKSRNTVFFQWFVASEGRKVSSLKRRVRSQLARWEMKNCMPWREAHFQIHVQSTPDLEHFWKLWCRKSAHRCGAQHIPKSKCTKHVSFGALLEVQNPREKTHLILRRQEAVATSPCQRDVYAAMLVGTELSHAAYDVPKKFTGVCLQRCESMWRSSCLLGVFWESQWWSTDVKKHIRSSQAKIIYFLSRKSVYMKRGRRGHLVMQFNKTMRRKRARRQGGNLLATWDWGFLAWRYIPRPSQTSIWNLELL